MSRKLPATLYHTMGCEVVILSDDVNVFLVSDRLKPIWHDVVNMACIDFAVLTAT
jgi:hypothetical protein